MNWKEVYLKNRAAFIEWVKEVRCANIIDINEVDDQEDDYWININAITQTRNNQHLEVPKHRIWMMPHYFDKLGIYIQPHPVEDYDGTVYFSIELFVPGKSHLRFDSTQEWNPRLGSEYKFPDRLSALEAGVEKAFEIRQRQLNAIPKQ